MNKNIDPNNQSDFQVGNNFNENGQPIDNMTINWRKYIFLILNNWYWFLISLFIALGVASIKNRYTLPSYKVTATLLIEDEQNSDDIMNQFRSIRYFRNRTELANEIAKLNAFSLHRRTIDSLGWDILWTGHGRVAAVIPIYGTSSIPFILNIDSTSAKWFINKEFELDIKSDSSVSISSKNLIDTIVYLDEAIDIKGWKFSITQIQEAALASYSFIAYNPNTLASQFKNKLQFESDEEMGTVIKISSTGRIPAMEIDYINKLCQNYIAFGLDRKRLIAENTLTFIEEQIAIIRDSLQRAEKQLLAFRLNNSVIDLSLEGKMAYEKLNRFFDQRNQLTFNRNYYDYLEEYILSQSDPKAIITPTLVGADDPLLMDQVVSIQKLYEEREQLGFTVEENNPGLLMKNKQIQNSRDKLLQILSGLIMNNDLAMKQIISEEKNIEKQLLTLPVSEQELLNIQRKHEVTNQFYTFLLQKQAEAGIQRASTISNIRILDRAESFNVSPVGKKKTFIYLVAIMIGLLLPSGIILLSDLLDTRVKELNDIKLNANLPILGIVAHDKTGNLLPVHNKPGSAFAESFRHIRTNLSYIMHKEDQKVIMVTSTISGEGKSFIALNLASILAMNNKKVLLCGMDLRRPTLHKMFNLNNSDGISRVLIGKQKLDDVIISTPVAGLSLLPAGPVPPNPAELIESDAMINIINEIRSKFDFVVIDTPPMALVTDAQLISQYTDANIFVIRQNYSRREMFPMINETSKKFKNPVSLVINDIRESKVLGYYYGYGYGYDYGYGYGYGYSREYGEEYFNDEI